MFRPSTIRVVLTVCLLACAHHAMAQCELDSLPAPGSALAIDGNTSIVGVWQEYDANLNRTGAAYIYVYDGTAWNQQAHLVASDAPSDVLFGYSVDVDGDVAIAGGPTETLASHNTAYVFRRTGDTWTEEAQLTPWDTTVPSSFARAVAVSGDYAAVASPYLLDGEAPGKVYVYRWDGTTWVQDALLQSDQPADRDLFGLHIAMHGNEIVVADLSGFNIYVYRRGTSGWDPIAKLDNSVGSAGGTDSLDFDGQTIVAGIPAAFSFNGRVNVWTRDGDNWGDRQTLRPLDFAINAVGPINREFGSDVAVAGNTLIVGAAYDKDIGLFPECIGNLTEVGAIYWHTRIGTEWVQVGRDFPVDYACGGRLGRAVAYDGGPTALAGQSNRPVIVFDATPGIDCNGNGINDGCEPDCNGNDIPDDCDLTTGTSSDVNLNGFPDECEPDCNQNGLPDDVDLAAGTSVDCNDNSVPDECDLSSGASADCNGDAIPDECEPDCNGNGIADDCDIAGGTSEDCNSDGVPDGCQPNEDCNGNGTRDICEIAAGTLEDCNADLLADDCQPNEDCDGNGVRDLCELNTGAVMDCNETLTADACDISSGASLDTDGNGIPDECDGTYVRIVPAPPLGTLSTPYPYGTVMHESSITVLPGTRVWFDIYVGGWAPKQLVGAQTTLDQVHASLGYGVEAFTFPNGVGAPLLSAVQQCADDLTCEEQVGLGSTCDRSQCVPNFNADPSRNEFWHDIEACYGPQQSSAMSCSWTASYSSSNDRGGSYLMQSFAVDIPGSAAGTYHIDFVGGTETFLLYSDGTTSGTDLSLFGVTVSVLAGSPCCLPDGACSMLLEPECVTAGGTPTSTCFGDCDADGIDDGCQAFEDCNHNGTPDSCELADHDCDANGVVDECQLSTDDCNGNGIVDACDVAAGAADCNSDNVPDECQLGLNDCDGNGIPDDCQDEDDCDNNQIPDACEFASGTAADCNANDVIDACDVSAGTSVDANGDCIPDECDPSPAPLADFHGQDKSRFISFSTAGIGCREMAIRVDLVALRPPGRGSDFAAFEGTSRWVGAPYTVVDQSTSGPVATKVAPLQCEPHVQDWGAVGLVNVYGPAVMPLSTYVVSYYDVACGDINNPACYSPALELHTSAWGDIVPLFYIPGSIISEPDFSDISAVVSKFLGNATPTRAQADLDPNVPNLTNAVDFNDIAAAVNSYLGLPYPYDGPTACP